MLRRRAGEDLWAMASDDHMELSNNLLQRKHFSSL